ncbi:SOS response-associated peptidase [Paenibacillus sp. NFR01]|uniref:SOS response-associated peptidase n=1 Tax=Paenibacillus sp. NFR01 TaxID=1566279 RepID=UPI0008BF88FD|nr:SOS response-associated peptidase [Paenibacillus sp. NFR01]SET37993.1 Putative SOS response-associated peptidase YedK [Paenibacillus sp. NFR01]
MCGRYTITVTLEELIARYIPEQVNLSYEPRYNVSPAQMAAAVISDGQANRMGMLKWGLIPSWTKDKPKGMINARAETLLEKPSFTVPFLRKRCLIPADSYYEWEAAATGKRPLRILLKSAGLFSFAGIYDTWTAQDGQKISSFAIITTEANAAFKEIHPRMPVILKPEDEAIWLDRTLQDPGRLMPLLRSYPAEEMTVYPVSAEVGNVRNDSPDCIKALGF